MGYLNQFPRTNFYGQDLGELIISYKELKEEFEEFMSKYEDVIEEHITNALNAYKQEVDKQFSDIINKINENDNIYKNEFVKLQLNIDTLEKLIETTNQSLIIYNDVTNNRLEVALKKYIDNKEIEVLVYNYFTGERITIQEMFNYLCMLHTENAITFNELIALELTFNTLEEKNVTYTDVALNGNTIL